MEPNTIYYFFSTTAQTWAALVAFGGAAIRERMTRADQSMTNAFLSGLQDLGGEGQEFLKRHHRRANVYWNDQVFRNRDSFFKLVASVKSDEIATKFPENAEISTDERLPNMSNFTLEGVWRVLSVRREGYSKDENLRSRLRLTLLGYMIASGILILLALGGIRYVEYFKDHPNCFACTAGWVLTASMALLVTLVMSVSWKGSSSIVD